MADLHMGLEQLGAELDYPATPDLAAALAGRLEPAVGRPRPRPLRALAIAVLVLLLLAATVIAASPSLRDELREIVGLEGATVERTDTLPPAPPPREPELGAAVTLDEANEGAAFRVLVPDVPGRPETVHLSTAAEGGQVTLVYRGGDLLVGEFRGDLHPDFVGKVAPEATRVERLRLNGERAVWISGAPHFFFYRGPNGEIHEETLREAGNVLLVERGRVLVRIEGARDRSEALAIARSLR